MQGCQSIVHDQCMHGNRTKRSSLLVHSMHSVTIYVLCKCNAITSCALNVRADQHHHIVLSPARHHTVLTTQDPALAALEDVLQWVELGANHLACKPPASSPVLAQALLVVHAKAACKQLCTLHTSCMLLDQGKNDAQQRKRQSELVR